MGHKFLNPEKHHILNMINYMTDYRKDKFTFEGFIPAPEDYSGILVEGVNYLAVHLSQEPIRCAVSDDETKESKFIQSGKSWVAMFYGSDNCSYIKRFDNKERMYKWFNKTQELHQDDSWCWYNS